MISALVVDDSAYNRVTISKMLESAHDIRVVASASNGEEAIKKVIEKKPDVIVLDLEMPVMDGFAFLRWLMANHPTPVIVVSSRTSDRSVFKALELGAVDFIGKPGGRISPKLEEIQADLVAKARQSSEIRIENVRRRLREEEAPKPTPAPLPDRCAGEIDLIVVGCSTGGPPALQHLFQSIPLLPVPIVVAQHMPPVFTRLFADRVDKLTQFRVKEAESGELIQAGVAYIGPGGMQTEVVRADGHLSIRVSKASAHDLYAPSVDRLFDSASKACGARLVGVVMTGMGEDGCEGIRTIRSAGGKTVAEAESTAVIFGMPGAAIRTGAVQHVLTLQQIPHAIQRFCVGE
jgi:two-component system chemotaxis response regulator CheB